MRAKLTQSFSQAGNTPLFLSVPKESSAKITQLLLEAGSSLEHKNRRGETPQHVACAAARDLIAREALYRVQLPEALAAAVGKPGLLTPNCCVVIAHYLNADLKTLEALWKPEEESESAAAARRGEGGRTPGFRLSSTSGLGLI